MTDLTNEANNKQSNKSESIGLNPIIWADIPDVDVIRVDHTYYMISTTMHLFPGGAILRSYDLINWEIATYLYEILDDTPGQRLDDGKGIYAAGMWAASLRYHRDKFYVCFVANDTRKTYLFTSESIDGPWKKSYINGFYHDCSLLFDNERVFIAYGAGTIYLTELTADLSGPLEGGLHRVLVQDDPAMRLGYEGAHLYKIRDRYYLFLIHWLSDGSKRRTEACYSAASLEDEFKGKDVLDDDLGYHNQGVAQGGIVDTPDGETYAMLFQDHDAVGRIPVLVPVSWENDFPVFGINGKVPQIVKTENLRPGYHYEPIVTSDDFNYALSAQSKSNDSSNMSKARYNINMHKAWQWNHQPDHNLWSVTERPGYLRLKTATIRPNVIQAKNTLSQRTMGPRCDSDIMVDGSGMKPGDYAGLVAMQSNYGCIALKCEESAYYIVMLGKGQEPPELYDSKDEASLKKKEKQHDNLPAQEYEKIKINGEHACLRILSDFNNSHDKAIFYYKDDDQWRPIGKVLDMKYTLDHFMGYRMGLFYYSTEKAGGHADFDYYNVAIK